MKIVICYGIWPSVDDGGLSVSPLLPNNFLYFFVELRHFTFLQIYSNFGYSVNRFGHVVILCFRGSCLSLHLTGQGVKLCLGSFLPEFK